MTLSEMANFVCTKINQTETDDVAACEGFLKRRYEMIWADQMWKDSIAEVSVDVDPADGDNAAGIVVLPEIIDHPIAVRAANRGVLVNPIERYYRIDLDMFIRQGTQFEMALVPPAWMTVRPAQSGGAGSTITITSPSVGDTSDVKVIWRDQTGKRYETTSALPSLTLTPDDDAGYFEIESVFKSTTNGVVTVTLNKADTSTEVLGTLATTATRTPSYQRIRVFDIPNQTATLRVAGKMKCDQLDFDNQEPALRGCENILLTLAQGDMLERERRYGQAQALFQEGMMLLEQLKRVETVQMAHNRRLIPQEGFVSQYDLYAQNLLSF